MKSANGIWETWAQVPQDLWSPQCGGPRHIHTGPIHLKFCLYKCVTFRMAPLARGEHKQPMDSAQRIKDLKVFATEGNFKPNFTVRWRGASVLAVLSKVRGCWTLLPSLTSRWEVQVLAIPEYSHEVMSLSFVLILFRNARQVSCLFIYDNYLGSVNKYTCAEHWRWPGLRHNWNQCLQ